MSAKMSTKKKKSFTAKPGSYTFRKNCLLYTSDAADDGLCV